MTEGTGEEQDETTRTVLGVDFGTRRIGLATADTDIAIATPLDVVEVAGPADAVARVVEAAGEADADLVVIGLPISMDGTHSDKTREVEKFAEACRDKLEIPVELWDERLTTAQAERVLLDADMSRAKRKRVRDKLAAQILLQSYVDAQQD